MSEGQGGPAIVRGPRNIAQEVEAALADKDGWDWFKQSFAPAPVADPFKPEDEVLLEFSRYADTPLGARVVAWLHLISDQSPYPLGTASIEETAIAAARHQGRASVGYVISKAIAEGRMLREKRGNT